MANASKEQRVFTAYEKTAVRDYSEGEDMVFLSRHRGRNELTSSASDGVKHRHNEVNGIGADGSQSVAGCWARPLADCKSQYDDAPAHICLREFAPAKPECQSALFVPL